MAETGFTHITVVPADEEEIVIHAGAKRAAEDVAPVATVVSVAPAAADAFEEVETAASVAPAYIDEADAKAEAQLAQLESSSGNFSRALHEAIAEERAHNPRAPKERYHETTLEDLQSEPMARMQKIILLVLLGLMVVFGVYCALRFGAHLF